MPSIRRISSFELCKSGGYVTFLQLEIESLEGSLHLMAPHGNDKTPDFICEKVSIDETLRIDSITIYHSALDN
jgi:hypothetical protein